MFFIYPGGDFVFSIKELFYFLRIGSCCLLQRILARA